MISSRPKINVARDYDRSYTLWHGDVKPVPQDLPYMAKFMPDHPDRIPSIQHPYIVWCEDNCIEPWAWWFDAFYSYIGFSSESEMVQFKLSCL